MGRWSRTSTARGAFARALLVACSSAALALVALPTGASADTRVPPSTCPPEISLAGIERAPGGVVFTGTVTAVSAAVGVVELDVIRWYRRGPVRGVEPGVHPATMRLVLGADLALAGEIVPARLPRVGSRLLVAGRWGAAERSAIAACGVVADVDRAAGAAWLDQAEARYAAIAPTPGGPWLPLDAPWMPLVITVLGLLLAASILEAIADAEDPLPAI